MFSKGDIDTYFSWIYTQTWNYWVRRTHVLKFIKTGLFSKAVYLPFHTPSTVFESFSCSTSLSSLGISVFLILDVLLGMKCYFIVVFCGTSISVQFICATRWLGALQSQV